MPWPSELLFLCKNGIPYTEGGEKPAVFRLQASLGFYKPLRQPRPLSSAGSVMMWQGRQRFRCVVIASRARWHYVSSCRTQPRSVSANYTSRMYPLFSEHSDRERFPRGPLRHICSFSKDSGADGEERREGTLAMLTSVPLCSLSLHPVSPSSAPLNICSSLKPDHPISLDVPLSLPSP